MIIKHRKLRFILSGWLAGLALCAAHAGETYQYIGRAYDLKTDALIYTENHTEHYENGAHVFSVVSYCDPKGKEMVRKRITFAQSRSAPTFKTLDFRTGYLEAAAPEKDGYRLTCRDARTSKTQSRVVKIPEPVVIDGGFDYFIRDNWDELLTGKTLKLRFAIASRRDYATFALAKLGEVTRQGVRCAEFKLSITGFVAGFFVDPIYVAYDLERKRLIEYRGLSNIPDEKGKCHKARIVFTYPAEP